jgi:hypothetical protein
MLRNDNRIEQIKYGIIGDVTDFFMMEEVIDH